MDENKKWKYAEIINLSKGVRNVGRPRKNGGTHYMGQTERTASLSRKKYREFKPTDSFT